MIVPNRFHAKILVCVDTKLIMSVTSISASHDSGVRNRTEDMSYLFEYLQKSK